VEYIGEISYFHFEKEEESINWQNKDKNSCFFFFKEL